MRTTVRLDPEVAAAAERLRRERRIGLGEAVNELARAGLSRGSAVTTFRQRTADVGLRIDHGSPFHASARGWMDAALNGAERVGLPWASLTAFHRISTHPRATVNPLTATDAWAFVTDWHDAEQAWVPVPGPRHRDVLGALLVDGDLRGNLAPDAHLAALAIEHGTGVCSFDGDFARFDGLRWVRPS